MRAAEVGEFLRARRRRIDPTSMGFPTDRRRGEGLRREELASLAGVTVSWLAKLEQGRAHAVSVEVLAALSRALRLDDAEREHLFALAGYRLDGPAEARPEVTPALRRLVDQLEPNPAYLLDRGWNMVAWNNAELRLFPKLGDFTDRPPNLLELVFLDDDLRRLMGDHDEEQVRLVAQFRIHRTEWPGDEGMEDLVASLSRRSTRFAELWKAREVEPFTTTRRRFDHPELGAIELDHHRLAVLDQPGMQLVVYT